jgi:choline dehydrogenase-like flavoprotein
MTIGKGYDAVVIGSGAGGGAAAWQLCQRGLKVLLLEAGPAFDPTSDYPQTQAGWERRSFPAPPGSRASLTYGDLGTLDDEYEDLASWSRGGFPWRLPPGAPRPPSDAGYAHVMGLGGSTLHFVGEAHRLHPDTFRRGSVTGQGADWPISYNDLEPFYTRAEQVVGVASDGAPDGRPRSAPYPMPAHPLGPGALALVEAGARIGQHWQVNPRAALSQPSDDRPACSYCGQCSRGCPLGDKGSTDVTFLRQAARTGRLTVVTGATVTRLKSGPNGMITRAEVIVQGRTEALETPFLFLSAGAVQTPRLLMLSASADQPQGLANSSGQVGRNFIETLAWRSSGMVPGLTGSHRGLPADAICWASDVEDPGGFRLNHTTLESGLNGPIAYANRLLSGHGAALKAAMRSNFGTALAVGAIGELVPDDRSRITLDAQMRDGLGLPVARISSVLNKAALDRLRRMASAARAVLAEAGAELAEESGSRDTFTATHVFGTARMGSDPATSVTDATGRTHDHPNFWIADASLFPSSGGGESPSLTIMALALRAADSAG